MQRCMYKCVLLFKGHLKCFSTPCRVSRLNMVMSRTGYNALLCHVILHNDRTELTCVMPPTIKCVIEVMSMVTCLEKWEKNTHPSVVSRLVGWVVPAAGGDGGSSFISSRCMNYTGVSQSKCPTNDRTTWQTLTACQCPRVFTWNLHLKVRCRLVLLRYTKSRFD